MSTDKTTKELPEKGQRWVERCGWWQRVDSVGINDQGRAVVFYTASRGGVTFPRQCSPTAWRSWVKLTYAQVQP